MAARRVEADLADLADQPALREPSLKWISSDHMRIEGDFERDFSESRKRRPKRVSKLPARALRNRMQGSCAKRLQGNGFCCDFFE